MNPTYDFNYDRDGDCYECATCVIDLYWNGTMVDAFPGDGFSMVEMFKCSLSDPIGDIYEANDVEEFERGEPLGVVYFFEDREYDLRVRTRSETRDWNKRLVD